MSGRQQRPDLPQVGFGQFGHAGGAKPDAPGMGRGQGKDLLQAGAGRGRIDLVAGCKGIAGKGGFDVHGQMHVGVAG